MFARTGLINTDVHRAEHPILTVDWPTWHAGVFKTGLGSIAGVPIVAVSVHIAGDNRIAADFAVTDMLVRAVVIGWLGGTGLSLLLAGFSGALNPIFAGGNRARITTTLRTSLHTVTEQSITAVGIQHTLRVSCIEVRIRYRSIATWCGHVDECGFSILGRGISKQSGINPAAFLRGTVVAAWRAQH